MNIFDQVLCDFSRYDVILTELFRFGTTQHLLIYGDFQWVFKLYWLGVFVLHSASGLWRSRRRVTVVTAQLVLELCTQ